MAGHEAPTDPELVVSDPAVTDTDGDGAMDDVAEAPNDPGVQ